MHLVGSRDFKGPVGPAPDFVMQMQTVQILQMLQILQTSNIKLPRLNKRDKQLQIVGPEVVRKSRAVFTYNQNQQGVVYTLSKVREMYCYSSSAHSSAS